MRDNWDATGRDVLDVIAACSSTHWSERKEGLLGLQALLRSGHVIAAHELKRLVDILGKMFTDTHTKVGPPRSFFFGKGQPNNNPSSWSFNELAA